jgi:hypothetical protein
MSKWTNESTALLEKIVGNETPVSQETVSEAHAQLGNSVRSVGSKLRSMGYDVQSASDANKSPWNDDTEAELNMYLENNPGIYTYAEIAASFNGGSFSAKSVQGKVLSMEMTSLVKKAEKVVADKKYTQAEEDLFIAMNKENKSIEEIAEALGKKINSVRGKGLSLSRAIEGFTIPHQASSHAQAKEDSITALGPLAEMTVEEISEKTGKTIRGIKTTLTRRGLTCKNYDGAKKAEKRAQKETA